MTNNGWIKLHRKIRDWEWYDNSAVKDVFIELLLTANHKANSWQGITIHRGQVVVGRKVLAKKLGFSEMRIRTALTKLKSTNEITIETTNRYSVVTIIHFDLYQQDNQEPNQQTTNKQPTDNQQLATNKNDKNIKNEENEKKDIDTPTEESLDEMEERLEKETWDEYYKTVEQELDEEAEYEADYLRGVDEELEEEETTLKQVLVSQIQTKKKTGITRAFQDKAFRYAKSLNIDLKNSPLKSRWIKLFKDAEKDRNLTIRIDNSYSYLVDYYPFNGITDPDHKIKYFLDGVYNGFSSREVTDS